jgi:hypothetical protein
MSIDKARIPALMAVTDYMRVESILVENYGQIALSDPQGLHERSLAAALNRAELKGRPVSAESMLVELTLFQKLTPRKAHKFMIEIAALLAPEFERERNIQ